MFFILALSMFCVIDCKTTTTKIHKTHKTLEILKVMTYNIRLDVASDGTNAWPKSCVFLSSQILFYGPDIMGIQEALPNQITDLKSELTNYRCIGKGREGNGQGEFSAIFYNAKKLEVLDEATFWLSETPNPVFRGWDATYRRVCAYVSFKSLKSDAKFWVFNTHLDHVGTEARLKGMQLILEKIQEVNINNLPVVLTGDFNVESDSELILKLKERMNDSKELADIVFGQDGTFNGFNAKKPATRRIDYIMVSQSSGLKVNKYAVLLSSVNLKYPSDHFPVYVELKVNSIL